MTSGEPNGVGDLSLKRGSWLTRANTVERQETPNRSRCIIFEHSKIWRNTLAVKSQHGSKLWRPEKGKHWSSAPPATRTGPIENPCAQPPHQPPERRERKAQGR